MSARRSFFAREVIQASAMDCGPASLKSLLDGFGTAVSYGRLREACQTDVDGTSIDTLEEVAVQLGLQAEQVMLPIDHLLLPEAQVLPALIVVRLPDGMTHFVVAWRRHGPLVQVMDPATGRRWQTTTKFLEECYVHTATVDAVAWRKWTGTEGFQRVLRRRLGDIGMSGGHAGRLIETALGDPGWRSIGALDAATRMTKALVSSGGLRSGTEANRALEHFLEKTRAQKPGERALIPAQFWSVSEAKADADGAEQVNVRGGVLIQVRGRSAAPESAAGALSPELAAALAEKPSRPGRELVRLLRADGILAPSALLLAFVLAGGGVMIQAVLLRGVFDLGRELGISGQRLGAMAALVVFALALLFIEFPVASGLLRLGRRLEARLRIAFLEKVPRLGDRYFQSRLRSDMAERSHSIYRIRHLPEVGGQMVRSVFELLLTTAGIIWLDPPSATLALVSAGVSIALPLLAQPALTERDLRFRSHTGALSRYYLDALLGIMAVRSHGAERSIEREHEGLLVEWSRAGFSLQRFAVGIEGLQFAVGFGLAAWLLIGHLARNSEGGGMLLLLYWALHLPMLGQEIAQVAWQYPGYRNTTLRLLEPLGALDEDLAPEARAALTRAPGPQAVKSPGMAVALENVSLRSAGHTILEDISMDVEAGSHVAIVGPSGAGKSSLVGIFLGWHRPANGRVLVDGAPLETAALEQRRAEIAWIDPAVHLWNRSFVDNLNYGSAEGGERPIGRVLEAAELRKVLEKLPEGLQTKLGEGGSMLSGGEGQRVRLGRGMLRSGVRLVILDEPFRGLDREQRRELLIRARRLWHDATLLCITHDVGETRSFERVLVIEGGRLVEQGRPAELDANPSSRYRALLDAEEAVRVGLWSDERWRRLRLEDGIVVEDARKETLWRAL